MPDFGWLTKPPFLVIIYNIPHLQKTFQERVGFSGFFEIAWKTAPRLRCKPPGNSGEYQDALLFDLTNTPPKILSLQGTLVSVSVRKTNSLVQKGVIIFFFFQNMNLT
jgi:hypothetical protein